MPQLGEEIRRHKIAVKGQENTQVAMKACSEMLLL